MTRRSSVPRRARRGKANPTRWIVGILVVAALGAIGWNVALQETADILVFKSSRCECCDLWVAHLRQQGFKVYVSTQEHCRPRTSDACYASDPRSRVSRFRACRSGHRGWSRGIGTIPTRSSPLTCRGAHTCSNSTEVSRILVRYVVAPGTQRVPAGVFQFWSRASASPTASSASHAIDSSAARKMSGGNDVAACR